MNPLRWNKTEKAENELIVSGYIHINTKDIDLFMSIPVAIIEVIFKFYYWSLLIWDSDVVQDRAIKQVPDTINPLNKPLVDTNQLLLKMLYPPTFINDVIMRY